MMISLLLVKYHFECVDLRVEVEGGEGVGVKLEIDVLQRVIENKNEWIREREGEEWGEELKIKEL